MLVSYSLNNFMSIGNQQTLSLVPSGIKRNEACRTIIRSSESENSKLLRCAGIFGANASGKTNFLVSLYFLRAIILNSTTSSLDNEKNILAKLLPFLLNRDGISRPITFELVFIEKNIKYRYGLEIFNNEIENEWLFWTKKTRETNLFNRNKLTVEYNQRSFKEATPFVQEVGDSKTIKNTKPTTPFISVLANFNGSISQQVINWFNNLKIISGLGNENFQNFSLSKYENDNDFIKWTAEILKAFQIYGIEVVKEDKPDDSSNDLTRLTEVNQTNKKVLKVKKSVNDITFPLTLESEGTIKLVYLLGPIYDAIVNNRVVFVDEFDSKFHSLLSKKIIDIFLSDCKTKSQLIFTAHDTNLLDRSIFYRDQIWFTEKDENQSTQLYSLVEFRDKYVRKDETFSKDYLSGKYGAIPLFDSLDKVEELIDG